MKYIKNNVDKIMLIVITSVIVTSFSVFAVSKYYAKDVSFTSSKEEWKVDNVNSALNDLYTNKDEVVGKDTSFTDWTRNTTSVFSDRFISSGNTLSLRNAWAKWVGQTGYYIACK